MLDNNTLKQMMHDMNRQMDLGLQGGLDLSTIAMLPSFVPKLPDGTGKIVQRDSGQSVVKLVVQLDALCFV